MNLDEPMWDVTVFTKNRDRLLEGDVAREFLCAVVEQACPKNLTGGEHFTVDGTLIEAWASARRSRQPDGELPRGEAQQRDAWIHHRSRRTAGAQRQWQGSRMRKLLPSPVGAV